MFLFQAASNLSQMGNLVHASRNRSVLLLWVLSARTPAQRGSYFGLCHTLVPCHHQCEAQALVVFRKGDSLSCFLTWPSSSSSSEMLPSWAQAVLDYFLCWLDLTPAGVLKDRHLICPLPPCSLGSELIFRTHFCGRRVGKRILFCISGQSHPPLPIQETCNSQP